MAEPVTSPAITLPPRKEGAHYARAQLEFRDVDHSGASMEVRVFVDRPDATAESPLDDDAFAGRFHIFGHGGCTGELGHCDLPTGPTDPFDLRLPHPLTPVTFFVLFTSIANRLVESGASEFTVTAVPLVHDYGLPMGRDAKTELEFSSISLVTY